MSFEQKTKGNEGVSPAAICEKGIPHIVSVQPRPACQGQSGEEREVEGQVTGAFGRTLQ